MKEWTCVAEADRLPRELPGSNGQSMGIGREDQTEIETCAERAYPSSSGGVGALPSDWVPPSMDASVTLMVVAAAALFAVVGALYYYAGQYAECYSPLCTMKRGYVQSLKAKGDELLNTIPANPSFEDLLRVQRDYLNSIAA